jgi:hypothetical protein
MTEPATCTIKLSARCQDEEEYLHTFLHELNHAIYFTMGNEERYKDEYLIDGHAALLLQALVTAE